MDTLSYSVILGIESIKIAVAFVPKVSESITLCCGCCCISPASITLTFAVVLCEPQDTSGSGGSSGNTVR